MPASNPPVPDGYSPVPPGKIANVVTCLEMRRKPAQQATLPPDGALELTAFDTGDVQAYRDLYRRIGQDWLWYSRLVMPEEQLRHIIADPGVEVHVLRRQGEAIGILELDFRQEGECELAFFGLVRSAIGHGAGRFLMEQAITRAWARPIRRFWVHTCSFDHPSALAFYQRAGFRPYAIQVEVHDDPRLTGHLPREAAPQVAVIEP
jgi:GNAT superfamily N-acetyltransferase